MTDIILATANARYSHASFGLRCLFAQMGDLRPQSCIHEFTIADKATTIVEGLLTEQPRIIGFGVYIWNITLLTEVVHLLKMVAPSVVVILGGPEVSYEYEQVELVKSADILITGEADLVFADTCRRLLAGEQVPACIQSESPDLKTMALPYAEYTDDDIAQRLVYVEASRGCAFRCAFCLSSLDQSVRAFPIDSFLEEMATLLKRGCTCFKFVDRTFNLRLSHSLRILDFFLERFDAGQGEGVFLHFEMVPDRLPDEIRERIKRFPAGAIQFEIGIQTFTSEVCDTINRKMDVAATEANFAYLTEQTAVHIHADLIAGLPGETVATFADSFDRLWHLHPHDIQLGILKRLKGTTIATLDMCFNPEPPYDIIRSDTFSFLELQRIKRLARFVDIFVNTDRFLKSIDYLLGQSPTDSPFAALLGFSDWIWTNAHAEHGISLRRQFDFLYDYMTKVLGCATSDVAEIIRIDFMKLPTKNGMPDFLRN